MLDNGFEAIVTVTVFLLCLLVFVLAGWLIGRRAPQRPLLALVVFALATVPAGWVLPEPEAVHPLLLMVVAAAGASLTPLTLGYLAAVLMRRRRRGRRYVAGRVQSTPARRVVPSSAASPPPLTRPGDLGAR